MLWDWIRRSRPVAISRRAPLIDTIADMGGIDTNGALRIQKALRETSRLSPDLAAATDYLMACRVEGLSRGRAACIATWVCGAAHQTTNRRRMLEMGFTNGEWLSGGRCIPRWRAPTAAEVLIDGAHQRLSGTIYPLDRGVLVNGELVQPGTMPGCLCVTGPAVPGFN